jgi:hypothetical protein
MRAIHVCLLATTILLALPAAAQFTVNGSDGQTVTIGPGGIQVHKPGKDVNVGIGGIQVRSTESDVDVGFRGVKVNKHPSTAVKTVTKSSSPPGGLSLADKLVIVEKAASGRTNPSKPLLVRIDELDMQIFGTKGTGSSATRIDKLAAALGVSFGTRTSVSSSSSSSGSNSIVNMTTTTTNHSTAGGAGGYGSSYIVLNSDNANQTVNCTDSTLVLNSNNCRLKLSGTCKELIVNGNNNHVEGDLVSFVQANGNRNHVTWRGNPPVVNNQGNENILGPQ